MDYLGSASLTRIYGNKQVDTDSFKAVSVSFKRFQLLKSSGKGKEYKDIYMSKENAEKEYVRGLDDRKIHFGIGSMVNLGYPIRFDRKLHKLKFGPDYVTYDLIYPYVHHHSAESYYATMNTISSPVEYIKLLQCCETCDIPAKFDLVKDSSTFKNNPEFLDIYEKKYDTFLIACKIFSSVVEKYFLSEAFSLIETAKIEDLEFLKSSYDVFLNRTVPEVKNQVNGYTSIRVFRDGKLDKLYPGKLYGRAKGIVLEIIKNAEFIIKGNLTKIESAIANRESAVSDYRQTRWHTDPFSNPFLIYDAEKSEKSNKPVFYNVAENKNLSFASLPKYFTDPNRRYTIEDYKKAPEIRDRFTKNINIKDGPAISRQDLVDLGLTEEGNALPWIAAIAAGGLILYQVTQG